MDPLSQPSDCAPAWTGEPKNTLTAHLNLGHATWGGGDAYQVKLPQHLVVCSHLTLSLEHLDADL